MTACLEEEFDEATSAVAELAVSGGSRLCDDAKLAFYGLYKQATTGDNTTFRPNFFDRKGRAKWVAWADLEGMAAEEAKLAYVELRRQLLPTQQASDAEPQPAKPSPQSLGPVISTLAGVAANEALANGQEPEAGSLHAAAMAGDTTALHTGLANGISPDSRDPDGCTPLHWAADKGHIQVIERLAESGADVNARDTDGQTPLHYAALSEQETAFNRLLRYGADAHTADSEGQSAAELAPRQWRFKSSRP